MGAITIEAVINEAKQIIAELPNDVFVGRVKLTIEPLNESSEFGAQPLTLEQARAKLLAAGALAIVPDVPDDVEPFSEEELEELGLTLPQAPPSEELINEDRGEY